MSETIDLTEQLVLSPSEHRSFERIVEKYHLPVDPELVQDANACLYLNETLNHADLQADHIKELTEARDELLAEFLDDPSRAYFAEVMNYARLCEGRSQTWKGQMGEEITEFVTTDHEQGKADLHFRIIKYPSGRVQAITEVPLRGDMFDKDALPFIISADTDGAFEVEQQTYERGSYHHTQLATSEGEVGYDRLKRFFLFSTEAVHLAYTRGDDEREHADSLATRHLYQKKFGRRADTHVA